MTPNDRKELERRKAERQANEATDAKSSEQAPAAEQTALTVK